MILAKRFVFLLVGFLIILLVAFWGFKNNFPGKSLSSLAQLHLIKQTGIIFKIKDLELGWQNISTPEISIHLPSWISEKTEKRILIIEGIDSPFSSLLTSGKIKIFGKTHGGRIKFSIDTFLQKDLDFSIESLKLEKMPLSHLNPHIFVSGNLSFSGKIKNFSNLQKQKKWFPEGYIRGRLLNSKIIFSGDATFFEFQFPELIFTEFFLDLQIGILISIKRIELKGSLDGKIDGSIKPNINRPEMSLVDLNVELNPSSEILEKLKNFSTILLPMQCGKKINVNIKGSMNRINLPTKNKC